MKLFALAAGSLLAASSAFADVPLLLDFEAPPSFESIGGFYAAQGAVFTPDALALRNDDVGTYFTNAPSPIGVMVAVGPDATLNIDVGFKDAISFSYSSSSLVLSAVNVYSGLDGTGTLLASFNLVANAQLGCSSSPFCRFDTLGSTFGGVARSVTFGATAGFAAIDNVSVTAVPEPASAALMALGVAGLLAARRRRG